MPVSTKIDAIYETNNVKHSLLGHGTLFQHIIFFCCVPHNIAKRCILCDTSHFLRGAEKDMSIVNLEVISCSTSQVD